jgi:hypothetical protein
VVLGMHRSGTSAVAGTAVRLGLAGPHWALDARADNPDGFYEPFHVVDLNQQILQAADCGWNVCLPFEPEALAGSITPANTAMFAAALDMEFGDATPGFVMKDPRLCVTLPAWLPALQAARARLKALIVLRHPAEVVRSLMLRNNLPEDETAPHWLHHMLEAERLTRGFDRAVLFYDDLLRDWRGCMGDAGRQAGIAWPTPMAAAEDEIDRFLDAQSRRAGPVVTTALVGPPEVRDLVNAAWIAFRHLADDPNSPIARPCLDAVHARFARWRRSR